MLRLIWEIDLATDVISLVYFQDRAKPKHAIGTM